MTRISIISFVFSLIFSINCKTFDVKTSEEFSAAIQSAAPGDTIHLSDGNYTGKFYAQKSGTVGSPIKVTGTKNSVVSGPLCGFCFNTNASHWILNGFTIANSPVGIVLSGAHHNILEDLVVRDIKLDGIQIRANSSDNVLLNSYIFNIAIDSKGKGGIVIGTDMSEWVDNMIDKSDRNQILNNTIGPVGGFNIVAKEGTEGGLIEGNKLDGSFDGVSSNIILDWILINGNGYTVSNNSGQNSIRNAIEINTVNGVKMSGCNNKIENNNCTGVSAGAQCAQDNSKDCIQKNFLNNNKNIDFL